MLRAEELLMVMADTWRTPQGLKALAKFRPEALSGLRAVFGNVEEDLPQVALGLRSEAKKPLQ
jgi:hypothetical protein